MRSAPLPYCALGLAIVIFGGHALDLSAATRAKENNSDALNLASSWTNNLIPGSADVALFNSTVTTPLTVSLGADTTWNQLLFANPGGDVTISAGNTLTLSNNTPIMAGAGAANLTINCDVVFAGPGFGSVHTLGTGRTLTLAGALRGRSATVTLGIGGVIRLESALTTQIGSPVQANEGSLGIGASSIGNPLTSGPLGTNLFIWTGVAQLFAYNGNQTLGNSLQIQSSPMTFASADDLTFTGLVDFNNANRALNITSNGVLRFTGIISNATGLTKLGPGTLELGSTNVATFANGLSVLGGTVRLLTNNVLPDTGGTIRMTNVNHVLDLNGFNDTVKGLTGANGSGNWVGTLDNTAPGTTSALTLGDNFSYVIAGMVQNSGPGAKLALVKVGSGELVLIGARTFGGGITNASASVISINSTGAAGVGPITLAHTNSELSYSGGGSMTWTNDISLAANTQPVISANDGQVLEIAGNVSGPGALRRNNSFGKQGALTFSGDNSFAGGFVHAGGAVTLNHPRAAGLGLFSLGDPSFFAGTSPTVVAGINLSGANAITNVVLVNRDFTIGGTHPIEFAGPVTWITNAVQRSINVTNPSGIVISGPMNGYGFNKTGQGLVTFNGVCSHNGPSTASVGPMAIGPGGNFTGNTIFLIGGSASLDVSAAPGFAVKPNQALRVESGAKVNGDVIINGTLTNNASFATVTFSNNLTMTASSTNVFIVNRFNQTGTNLTCLGTLTFGGHLIVNNFSSALQAGDTFKLFSFTGNPGSFASLTLPALDTDLAWNTSNLSVDGTISVVSASSPQPQFANPQLLNATNFIFSINQGATNGQFRVLTHTNADEPVANWIVRSTNTYDGNGSLTVTNAVDPTEPRRFFRVVQP